MNNQNFSKFLNKGISTPVAILIIVLIAIITGGIMIWQYSWLQKKKVETPEEIKNFEECIAKGYPILESYPRQCKTPDGETFTEDIGNELEKFDLIRVSNPRPNKIVQSPLEIKGEARGYWFFEADFPVYLLDANGEELGAGIAQAKSDWMTEDFVPFEAKIEFQAPATEKGILIFKKDNPSGLPEHDDELRIPVRFSNEIAEWSKEIKNAEYYSRYYKKNIRLEDGRYYKEPDPMISSFGIEVSVEKIAIGDLDNDGKKDAAVILRNYNVGGSIANYDLCILKNKNGKLDYLAYTYLGYGVEINSINIQSGEIVLDMVIHDSDDPPFWPTVSKIFKYKLSGNIIEKIDETADWKIYRNEEYGFEMKYPEDFFPEQVLQPKTKAIQCDYANFLNNCPTEMTTINGMPFCLQETGGAAAAGTTYTTYNYTTVRDMECFVVSFTVPYPNCSNYLPIESQEIQEAYDKCRLDNEVIKPEIINKMLSTFRFLECSSINIPNYEVAKNNDGNLLEFYVDLNGDQKEEFVRVYRELTNTGTRTLPIMVKIFSGTKDCPKEKFNYKRIKENEVYLAEVMPNFWGDGRNVVMVQGVSTGYGSGSSVVLRFFTYQNGKYVMIEGPQFSGHNWQCCKFDDENVPGKKIIGAESRWAEDYSDYCAGCPSRFKFFIYTWNGEKYIKTEAGTTKNKYSGNINEILQKEPSVLNVD